MHGILSLHGRKQAQTWTCLVCSTTQPSIEQVSCPCGVTYNDGGGVPFATLCQRDFHSPKKSNNTLQAGLGRKHAPKEDDDSSHGSP